MSIWNFAFDFVEQTSSSLVIFAIYPVSLVLKMLLFEHTYIKDNQDLAKVRKTFYLKQIKTKLKLISQSHSKPGKPIVELGFLYILLGCVATTHS